MSESWMKKHAKNLLSTMPVDDKASALHSHGPIDPKTGKKTHPQLDPSKFDYKSNPNDPRTDISKEEQSKIKIKNAKIAAERKLLRESNDPAIRKLSAKVKTLKDIGKYSK